MTNEYFVLYCEGMLQIESLHGEKVFNFQTIFLQSSFNSTNFYKLANMYSPHIYSTSLTNKPDIAAKGTNF